MTNRLTDLEEFIYHDLEINSALHSFDDLILSRKEAQEKYISKSEDIKLVGLYIVIDTENYSKFKRNIYFITSKDTNVDDMRKLWKRIFFDVEENTIHHLRDLGDGYHTTYRVIWKMFELDIYKLHRYDAIDMLKNLKYKRTKDSCYEKEDEDLYHEFIYTVINNIRERDILNHILIVSRILSENIIERGD